MSALPKFGHFLSRQEIVRKRARHLQLSLWNNRNRIWKDNAPRTPIDSLQPGVAFRHEGYEVVSRDVLGEEWREGRRANVAGLLDRVNAKVYVSAQEPFVVQNFTLAHELGHALLHPHLDVRHREFPKDGPCFHRDREEVEADWFATEFLMPEKQVRLEFASRFGEGAFELNDETAFALCSSSVERILLRCRSQRDLSKLLAEAAAFGGVVFPPLAKRFSVSTKAMAIRLDELDLVSF